jgi:hypothetical protein
MVELGAISSSVAVGRGFCDGARRDDGAGAGPVLDYEGLAQPLLQPASMRAMISVLARGERHDDGDGVRRVVLRPGRQ